MWFQTESVELRMDLFGFWILRDIGAIQMQNACWGKKSHKTKNSFSIC